MESYSELTREELNKEKELLEAEYKEIQGKGYSLSMARGKPGPEQFNISNELLNSLTAEDIEEAISNGEVDPRNYGGLLGLDSARALLGGIVGQDIEHTFVMGNSSLNIMYDMISRAYSHGIMGNAPWKTLPMVKFLCPSPGYDRHFAISEYFGMELISIPMTQDGPDMEMVEAMVSRDEAIKGIWCVPKFSNPQGYVYSDEVIKRFAKLKPKAKDFRIFWDNAYCVHYLYEPVEILDIVKEAENAGNPDIVYEFMSLSKVTFAGAGISALISSPENIKDVQKTFSMKTIGYDKINQLRHVKFFKKPGSLHKHMEKQANFIRPKFEAVMSVLDSELKEANIGSYYKPKGGYFIAYKTFFASAKRVVELAKNAGMEMTKAGACFPYGNDPQDAYIRIAPTFPSVREMEEAAHIFAVCVKLASIERLL